MMTHNIIENLFSSERYIAAILGTILASLGLLVFAKNALNPGQEFRWWAMFILLPALLLFGSAWAASHWQAPYRVTLGLFGLGLIVLAVAAMFLLNLSWERWWPVMLITPTLILFLLGLPDQTLSHNPEAAAWIGMLAWSGGAAVLLGLTFLAGNFHLIDLRALTQRVGWWGVFVAICALGAAIDAFWLWGKTGGLSLSILGLALMAIFLFVTAGFEWFRLDWRLHFQWLFIATGLGLILSFLLTNRVGGTIP